MNGKQIILTFLKTTEIGGISYDKENSRLR